MKHILYLALIHFLLLSATSCKENVEPTLIVTAVDSLGNPLSNLTVISSPCYFNQDNCDTARLNPNFYKEQLSNSQGQVIFEYPRSAVLDIVVFQASLDTNGDTLALSFGQNVVALETKELKKDEKNEYETRVIVDKPFP